MSENNCAACKWQHPKDDGHCYMFRVEPVPCAKYTPVTPPAAPDDDKRIGPFGTLDELFDALNAPPAAPDMFAALAAQEKAYVLAEKYSDNPDASMRELDATFNRAGTLRRAALAKALGR